MVSIIEMIVKTKIIWHHRFGGVNSWVFVYRHWCEENEMVFVSHEVPFPATSDRRSRVAGNGTEWEVKTIELSSSTSGGEQWAFLHFFILTAVKKTEENEENIFCSFHIPLIGKNWTAGKWHLFFMPIC